MKANYLKEDGKRWDIRASAGKKLDHFNVTQGACSGNGYIYMAFEQKANKAKKREHRIKIVELDLANRKVLRVSAPLNLGHANDMCIFGDELLVTHSAGKKVIHRVSIKTFRKLKDIDIKVPDKLKKHVTGFNGITRMGDLIVLRCMGGSYVMYLNQKFKYVDHAKFTKPFDQKEDSQGMVQAGETIWRAYSRLQSKTKNYICKFKKNGKLISKARLNTKGELESVFFINGQLYATIYRKKKIDGKKRYMAYICKCV